MKKERKKRRFFPCILFILGFLIAAYPIFSQWYYRSQANEEINRYISAVSQIDEAEITERIRLAEAYNSTLAPVALNDPFSESEKKRGIRAYARMLEVNEKIGFIEIPRIGQNIPIYAGTSENVLQKGAGHMEGTSLPVGGTSTHTVITAHRGLPTARLFTDLDKMKKGDVFFIHVLNRILAYEVDQILTIPPTDFDPIMIREGEDYATLLTCTPYMINTDRLLVRGKRIDYVYPIEEQYLKANSDMYIYMGSLVLAVLLIIALIWRVIIYKRRIKRLDQKTTGELK